MNSQRYHNKDLYLNKSRNILNEIVDIEKFKKLDDRYIITKISRENNMRCDFDDNKCNVYYRSFGLNFSFDKNNLKTIVGFINPLLFNQEDEDRFMYFLKNIFKAKDIVISSKYFREFLNNVWKGEIKEGKYFKFNMNIYVNNIKIDDRDLIFMMIELNA